MQTFSQKYLTDLTQSGEEERRTFFMSHISTQKGSFETFLKAHFFPKIIALHQNRVCFNYSLYRPLHSPQSIALMVLVRWFIQLPFLSFFLFFTTSRLLVIFFI